MRNKSMYLLILLVLFLSGTSGTFPFSITKIGEWHCGDCQESYGYDIAVKGDYVYIAGGEAGLIVLDVSEPASPKRVARYGSEGKIVSLHLEGSYLFAADTGNRLSVVDISNAPLLRPVNCRQWHPGTNDISIEANNAVLATMANGITIMDITRPCHPVPKGNYDPGAMTCFSRVIVRDAVIYSICGCEDYFELYLVDISNPEAPVLLGTSLLDSPRSFALSGDYVFIGECSNLTIFDVASPSSPTLVTTCNVHGFLNDLFIKGDTLLAAADDLGLMVIDINEVDHPVIKVSYNMPGRATAVCAKGDYIYLAGGRGNKLYVFHIRHN